MRSLTLIVLALIAVGCGDYPCLDETTVHSIAPVPFTYDQRVRYTYWWEDGAQRTTFEREQIPENGRGAVLVHVEGVTAGGLHGAAGWAADVSKDVGAEAGYVPMAIPRAAAYSAYVGAWSASWLQTRAGVLVEEMEAARSMNEALGIEEAVDPKADPLDPETLLKTLKGEDSEPAAPDAIGVASAKKTPDTLREELGEQGISIDGLKLTRALRVAAARQPTPRDFGLSLDVHPIWVFVEEGCKACDAALAWLDDQGHGYHAMRVSDPSSATTLKSLSRRADIDKPAVPSLWKHGQLLRGFDSKTWAKELRNP